MNITKASANLASYFRRNQAALEKLPTRETQLLELASLMAAAEHYRRKGMTVSPRNLFAGRFRVKVSSRGYVWNYSFLRAEKSNKSVELHSNLSVRGAAAEDPGYYVVDIGVVKADVVPTRADKTWRGAENADLVTFLEAKKMVIYPMLLAHFVGMAHEIAPRFLRTSRPPAGFPRTHFFPTLAATGYFTANARAMVDSFPLRHYWLRVLPDLDTRISSVAFGGTQSPLE